MRIQVSGGFWWVLPPAPSLTQAPPTLPLPGDSQAQPASGRPASLAPLSPSAPSRDVKPQTLSHKGQGLECNCWVSILGKTLHLQSLNFSGWEPVGMYVQPRAEGEHRAGAEIKGAMAVAQEARGRRKHNFQTLPPWSSTQYLRTLSPVRGARPWRSHIFVKCS